MYAIIGDGQVVDLVSLPEGVHGVDGLPFLSSEQKARAVGIPDGMRVLVGWGFRDGQFVAPDPIPLGPARQPRTDPAGRAMAALAAGCAVVSETHPDISGTYPLDERTQLRIMTISLHIAYHHEFPCGVLAYPRLDTSGEVHLFPTTSVFDAWATALLEYIAAIEMIIETGEGELPAQPVSIA